MLRKNRPTEAEQPTTDAAQRLSDELGLLEEIYRRGGEIVFGAPTRCPDCGAMGIVHEIVRAQQRNGCLRCGAAWTFSRKAVVLFEDAHALSDQPEVVGMGVLVADLDREQWAKVTRERFVGMHKAFEPDPYGRR